MMDFVTPENLTFQDVERALDEAFAATGHNHLAADLASKRFKVVDGKFKRGRPLSFTDDEMLALRAKGKTQVQAARHLGCHVNTLAYRCSLLGIRWRDA